MKVIVYSAIYGNYDTPKVQPMDFIPVLFTDSVSDSEWAVKTVKREEDHPRMKAKYFKCNPHRVLDCDVSIWIDGSATVQKYDFIEWALSELKDNDMAVIKHPERNCIYKEAEFCKGMAKYASVDVMGQVEAYRKEGFPENYGLWACGLLVRRHNKRIKKFNEMWWEHNLKYTYQDQLSFPVCVKEAGVKLKTIDIKLSGNGIISFDTPHKSIL